LPRQAESLCDERLDLLLAQELEQGGQILSKPLRLEPFERLDTVGNHRFLPGRSRLRAMYNEKMAVSTKALATGPGRRELNPSPRIK
jgi:hypothetical protein